MNVGASKPEDYGDYFAWGETKPKSKYDWSPYKWCNGSKTTITKYGTNSSCGIVDNKTTLELPDDAARVNWGGTWRVPTSNEISELKTKCTWTRTTQNDVKGFLVTGPNGNHIFLPAASFLYGESVVRDTGSEGYYWSSSLNASSYADEPNCAYYFYFMIDKRGTDYNRYKTDYGYRYDGQSVRLVTE